MRPLIALKLPLFSRFVVAHGSTSPEKANQYLDRDALYASILEEIVQIIGARCNETLEKRDIAYDCINYGIPDITTHTGKEFVKDVQRQVTAAIQTLDPRLDHVVVKASESKTEGLTIEIQADVAKAIFKDFKFMLKIKRSGLVSVEE